MISGCMHKNLIIDLCIQPIFLDIIVIYIKIRHLIRKELIL